MSLLNEQVHSLGALLALALLLETTDGGWDQECFHSASPSVPAGALSEERRSCYSDPCLNYVLFAMPYCILLEDILEDSPEMTAGANYGSQCVFC